MGPTGHERYVPRPDAPIVRLDDLKVAIKDRLLADAIVPAHRIPPPRLEEEDPEGDLWVLRADLDAWRDRGALTFSPMPHDDLLRVYIIELEGCTKPQHAQMPCLYVGQSWHPPRGRFIQHLLGYKHSASVYRWGTRLRPDLYATIKPTERRIDAETREMQTARQLDTDGFAIHGVDISG